MENQRIELAYGPPAQKIAGVVAGGYGLLVGFFAGKILCAVAGGGG